eukprot:1263981-Pyramimonas_sp.AAC.1
MRASWELAQEEVAPPKPQYPDHPFTKAVTVSWRVGGEPSADAPVGRGAQPCGGLVRAWRAPVPLM